MKSKRAREAATAAEAEDFLPVDDSPIEKKRKRSDDENTEVKQKKAKKDKKDKKKDKKEKESRREKKDKRKNLQDLPEEDAADEDADASKQAPAVKDGEGKESKKEKKRWKKEKKEKKRKEEGSGDDDDEEAKKAKKDKKKKPKDEAAPAEAPDAPDEGENAQDGKTPRHIVFVGNLPFTATSESIKAHFASLKPMSVRCLKNKDDDRPCRGIAFVEFANVWTMRTCLDKFHHSEFEGRRINIELTAGGGGGTKFRRDKIRDKNKKLDENRSRRIEKEKAAKGVSAGGASREESSGGIHPSRLARNPGLGM
ncbi:hypothetical protein ED733_002347 [Metarhizium rileyi]|uniref:RRM domain-containing protein n=1 Tax=Metarhizium rileyi (strain RCEF 4871) TaxID=1649241 RepID=A0A5C6GCW2_METRR|nr:hypothetical protein ED733_002347 [Metarhizium rileyi]